MCLFAVVGCALIPASPRSSSQLSNRPVLPPIQASPEAILLEVFFLERPAEDHLLTTGVWKDIDQIGSLATETRMLLHDNGLRIGNVSSNPPPSVQRLLGRVTEIQDDTTEGSRPMMGFRRYVSPGVETEIPTGIVRDQCEISVREGDRTKSLQYVQAGCVFRMKASRLQEGWVRVDFLPEIHHGGQQTRFTPTENGFLLRGGQEIDVRNGQRFSVTMNVGELILVTSTCDAEGTLGDRFFCHTDHGMAKQRVLVVRVIDSGHSSAH